MLPNILDIVPRRKKLTNEDEGTPQIQTLGGTEQVNLPTPVPVDQPLPEFQSRSMLGARDVYDAGRTIPLSGGGVPKFGQAPMDTANTVSTGDIPQPEVNIATSIVPRMPDQAQPSAMPESGTMPVAPVAPFAPSELYDKPEPFYPDRRSYENNFAYGIKPEDEKDPYIRQQRLRDEGASKNKWWKRMLQGALRGLAAGGSGGLAGGLGGALVGAAVEGIFPSVNTKFKTQGYLDKTQGELADEQKQQDWKAKQQKYGIDLQKDMADIESKRLENIGKMLSNQKTGQSLALDPVWNVIKEQEKITKEQADYMNKVTGTNLFKEGSWQEFIEKVDPGTGKSVIRPKTDPRYSVNPTISPDATVPPVPVSVNGIGGYAKMSQILPAVAAEANANAQRVQSAATTNANNALEVAKTNAKSQNDYYQAVLGQRMELLKNAGAQGATSSEANSIATQMGAAAEQMNIVANQLATATDEKTIDALNKQMGILQQRADQLQRSFDDVAGKSAGLQTVWQGIQGIKIPKPNTVNYSPVAPVQTQTIKPSSSKGGGGKKKYSATDIERVIRQ